jgi:type II secretory pathway pseudopilin PulG
MNQNVMLTLLELGVSLVIEGLILSMVFNWISNRSQQKQQDFIIQEMNNIEKQNKYIFEQLQNELRTTKTDLINQVKESQKNNKG